jgi:anti-sigma factor RsiW
MKCDIEKLQLYLDKKLDTDDQLEVLEHLEECEHCFDAVYMMYQDARFFLWQKQENQLAG